MSAHNGLLQTPDNSERIVPRIVLSHQQYFQYSDLTVTCGGFFNNMTKWRVLRNIVTETKDSRGRTLDHLLMASPLEERLTLKQFLRFGETRPIVELMSLHSGDSSVKSLSSYPTTLHKTPDNSERIVPRIVLSHQQYFQYTDLTVTCGGFFNNMTKWRVLRNIVTETKGRYKCGTSGSKEFSEENLLKVKAVVLECPDEPVKEGESVTLSCRDKMAASYVTYSFYKDDKERTGSSTGELTLMEVSKTDEGVYKCKSSELRESEAQWLAVAGGISTSVHNASGGTDFKWSFLIVLVALLLLLLLGFIYRKYKGKCAQRQDSGHEVVEPQETCLYSQISNNNFDTQDINAGGQSADAEMLYASVNKKRKKQKQNCPDPVYSVVNKKKHKQAPSSSGSKVEKSV
uniref:Ig-like domain-containing protein n=1 Tax=Knipowitschia caucasica TaxID=637954 RepID=A0AAV2KQV6_KNICA